MAQKYQVAVVPAALQENDLTAQRDGEPGQVTAILNHEWPMAVTLNGGHPPPALFEVVRPPGARGAYLLYTRGGMGRDPFTGRPFDPSDPNENKRVLWSLQVDIDLARITVRDIQDLADEFLILVRHFYPYAQRFPRGVPRPAPSLLAWLDGPVGVALPTSTPAPTPRALSVQIMLAPVTTRHFAQLVREFKIIVRRYIPRGGTRSGDALAWLHTALPGHVARHLRRFDLHRDGLRSR